MTSQPHSEDLVVTLPAGEVIVEAGNALAAFRELCDWADELRLAYAWISSGDGQAEHWQTLPLHKVGRAVIGIHFAQTEPHALRQLAELPDVLRVVEDTAGVFHPKLIVGIRGEEAQAIVGSSNFTGGGFGRNTEINLRIRGRRSDARLAALNGFIDEQWSRNDAFWPDDGWLRRYESAYRGRPRPPAVPESVALPTPIGQEHELDIGWPEYFDLICAQKGRVGANEDVIHIFEQAGAQPSYIEEIEAAQRAFQDHGSFAVMPEEERRVVAGWSSNFPGWFGSTRGAGRFKNRVRTAPDTIASHLDPIPSGGPIGDDIVEAYFEGMIALAGIGLPVAARLLAVKRPDRFFAVNGPNRKRVAAVFGEAPRDAAQYLELHRRIWDTPWFNSPEPNGVDEVRVWRARVALLDGLLYESKAPAPEGDVG